VTAPAGARASASMRRTLGPVPLAALGVATIVGSGIFVLVGEAASQYAGPAVAVSFVLAGVAAGLAALCYAELCSAIPVTGSTYTFVSVALGPLLGWLVGWSILLEYLLGGAAIATGWAGYFDSILGSIGIDLPTALTAGPFDDGASGVVNLPAVLLIVALVALLCRGARESTNTATAFTLVKVGALVLLIVVGAFHVTSTNYEPFVPAADGFGEFGVAGVVRAAGVVFFAYIGFDVVCTAAQEARNPQRTVPFGLVGALLVATTLYVAVALVLVGLADYRTLGTADPLSTAIEAVGGIEWLADVVDVAAVVGLAAGVLAVLYGLSRIFMRMAEDGAIPRWLGRVDEGAGVPRAATIAGGAVMVAAAALIPISTLTDLISVGTLLAFFAIAISVLVLRRSHPDLERPFRLPFGPVVPVAAAAVTVGVAALLPAVTLVRLVIWVGIGLAIFLAYSRPRVRDPRQTLVEDLT
jgi:APA family basic amino acid/polyamine antiporter